MDNTNCDIPPQYRDLPSDVVEELWSRKLYVDPTKQKQEDERRERALRAIRKKEQSEEAVSRSNDSQQIQGVRTSLGLSPNTTIDASKVNVDFDGIAANISFDEKNPPKADTFLPIAGGNMFGDDDEQTLAGKVIGRRLYDELVLRQDSTPSLSAQETLRAGKDSLGDFVQYLSQKQSREVTTKDIVNRPTGVTGFHLNGEEGRVSRDHLFYFNKSRSQWKNPKEKEVRAYLTLKPSEISSVQRHFVDLCNKLLEADIDFSAKAASPNGLQKRTDNMVLYIAVPDQARAGQLIKEFLTERNIGDGHVLAAIPSPQDGLSWALEPDERQNQIWQAVSGSSEKCSYNGYIASMVAPAFLRKLASTHRKRGNIEDARRFEDEAIRIEGIVKR